MTKEQFEREKVYEITIYLVRSMFRYGLLTEEEVRIIVGKLKEKYSPLLGSLYPSNA